MNHVKISSEHSRIIRKLLAMTDETIEVLDMHPGEALPPYTAVEIVNELERVRDEATSSGLKALVEQT